MGQDASPDESIVNKALTGFVYDSVVRRQIGWKLEAR